ncbi:MAG TPA: alpha/beta hydrolase [Thiobacillaceae bacterium]|nr:alpha/beta hydrolase [Thiobacillaceae bacterium]
MNRRPEPREPIVLVHGLWLAGWVLAILAARLRRCGYDTRIFPYPSMGASLSANAAALARFAESLDVPLVHFIGHSMGGLVILKMLETSPELRGGRAVLLGSPYGGSRSAEALARQAAGRLILGHSLMEWLRGPRAEPKNYELGVLAGCRTLGLGRLVTRLPDPNDGVVTEAEARVPGMTDFICLRVSHTEMLWSRKVSHQVCTFLQTGRFDHREAPCS